VQRERRINGTNFVLPRSHVCDMRPNASCVAQRKRKPEVAVRRHNADSDESLSHPRWGIS